MAPKPDPMDTDKVLECLNEALELQHRSILQFNLASGAMFGLEVQAVTSDLWQFAQAELDETRRLVEKIAALGGDPTTNVAKVSWNTPTDFAESRMSACRRMYRACRSGDCGYDPTVTDDQPPSETKVGRVRPLGRRL